MLSSANKLLPGLAAAAGIAAFAMPLVTPWHLLTVLAATLAVTVVASGRQRILIGSVAIVTLLFVMQGYLSSPLAAACLSASALAMTGRLALSIGVLVLNLSTAASAQSLLGDLLYQANIEAAAPAVLGSFVLALASTTKARAAISIGSGLLSLITAWGASKIVTTPEAVLAAGAIPVTLGFAFVGSTLPTARRAAIPMVILLMAALSTWGWLPPKEQGETWLLLPDAPDAYESLFFKNYVEALRFAGINAKQAVSVDEIPADVTLLMPWMTAALPGEGRIGKLARERRWTVIIGGEHTDMGEVSSRIAAITGRGLLRQDLTAPRGNTDNSGPMRITGISAWPHEAILNRGASVSIASLTDKVLLAGDGWWAEPNIGEWLWVGDYVWRHGDRAGRIAMAAITGIGGARWVVLGDNSPMVNRQLIADPRAVIHILQAASLWPAFLADLLVVVVAAALVIGIMPLIAVVLPVVAACAYMMVNCPSRAWQDFNLGESGFHDRNFNNVIADYPGLVDKRRLIRLKTPVSEKMTLPNGPATIFMLVDGTAEVAGIQLDHCHRLGSLSTEEGPYLMDAQACRVTGNAKVLIGTKEAAAAISLGESVIILDTAFLGQKAPLGNAKWLLEEIGR